MDKQHLRDAIEALGRWRRAFYLADANPRDDSIRQSVEQHAYHLLVQQYPVILTALTVAESMAAVPPVAYRIRFNPESPWIPSITPAPNPYWESQRLYTQPSQPVAWGHPSGEIVWIDPDDEDTTDFSKAGDGKWQPLCRCAEQTK